MRDSRSPVREDESEWSGYILVGGQSARMGVDKASMVVDQQWLTHRVADALRPVTGSITVVGDRARYAFLGFPVVEDAISGWGPLAGITAALGHSPTAWNLICACDMPAVPVELLERIQQAASCNGTLSDTLCVVPQTPDGRIHPLCAAYHRGALPVLDAAIRSGIRKVMQAIEPLHPRIVAVKEQHWLENLNTPDQAEAFMRGSGVGSC